MLTPSEVRQAMLQVWDRPLLRNPNSYGASQIGFCLEKINIQIRSGIPPPLNAAMWIGKMAHSDLVRIIAHTTYGIAHGLTKRDRYMNRKNAPKFEAICNYTDPRGFFIEGHCDCDLPAMDRIVEFKTTGSKKEWLQGDPLTDIYISQANAYAYIKHRSFWEIWILYKEFDDLGNAELIPVTVFEGQTDQQIWENYLDRVYTLHTAVLSGVDLVGPEISWECRYCSYKKLCPNYQKVQQEKEEK